MARTDYDDLAAFLTDDALKLPPIKSRKHPNGKSYSVPSPDAETGLWLSSVANIGMLAASGQTDALSEQQKQSIELDDDDERNFHQRVLGTAYDEMLADGVPWVVLQRLSSYVFTYYGVSPEVANDAMKAGAFGGPKAPNRPADRQPATPKKPSTRSAAPKAQPASGASRTTRRAAGTSASRGATSSGTGRSSK